MAAAIMGGPGQSELGVELTHSFCRTDPNIARHIARITFLSDHRADLGKSPVPALILQCSDDLIAPVCVGRYLHRTLPVSTVAVIETVGHCPHIGGRSVILTRDSASNTRGLPAPSPFYASTIKTPPSEGGFEPGLTACVGLSFTGVKIPKMSVYFTF